MYRFSRAIYRELAEEIVEDPHAVGSSVNHERVLRACEAAARVIVITDDQVAAAALGALAYWGHHTGWTLPKFSSLTGNGNLSKDDWCAEHGVPESRCVECIPGLLPKAKEYGWCKTHGIPNCPLEHPDIAQLKTSPNVTPADLERAVIRLQPVARV